MRQKQANFTEGKLFFPILLFTLPIIATGILQLLYNMADQIVVGQFSGDANALGAVGSSSALNSLFVNIFMGITAGSSVVISQFLGARRHDEIEKAVHTSIALGIITGVGLGVVAFFLARPLLVLLGTKNALLASATTYVRIIACGLPFSAVYNFGAAVLRSAGDSKTPLGILATSGLVNVLFNLLFVIVFHMSVAGVALATVLSQAVSAVWVLLVLARRDAVYKLSLRRVRIEGDALRRILRIGVPSALQSSLFSVSNMIIQSAVNTFPTTSVSGFAVSGTVEGFTYTTMHSFYQASVTFTGQNFGAKNRARLRKVLLYTLLQVVLAGALVGWLEILFAPEISSLFIDTTLPEAPLVIAAAVERSKVILSLYFVCGIMEVMAGYLRGVGCSVMPMISSVFGVCCFRAAWVFLVFPYLPQTAFSLFVAYIFSWLIVIAMHLVTTIVVGRRMKKELG